MTWRDLAQVSLRLSWWLAAKGVIILDVEEVRIRIKIAIATFRLVELRSKWWWWWWWWWCLQWWRKGEGQSKERNGDSLNVSGALLHLFQVTMTGLPLQTLVGICICICCILYLYFYYFVIIFLVFCICIFRSRWQACHFRHCLVWWWRSLGGGGSGDEII